MRIYAIGDIHGQLDMLWAAHNLIDMDRSRCGDADAPVVHLGDYCDRGPDSAGVIQFLIDGKADGRPWRTVLGNHDRMFRLFMKSPPQEDPRLRTDLSWLHPRLGGLTTLASYGVDPGKYHAMHQEAVKSVPAEHQAFLAKLDTFVSTDDLIFAHAGIRPGASMSDQTEDDLIWIRDTFLNDTRDHGKLVVHGHTPVETAEHCGNRINLDSGAGYDRPMTAAVFEGRECWVLTENGRRPLLP